MMRNDKDNFAASEIKRTEHGAMNAHTWNVPRAKWEAAERSEFSGSRRKLLTAKKHGHTNAGGIQRHALRLAFVAASTELQARAKIARKFRFSKYRVFGIFRYSQFARFSFDIFVSQQRRANLRDVIFYKVSKNKLVHMAKKQRCFRNHVN